jgi:hypothetical protein
MKKIQQNNLCPAQETFTKCITSWLKSLETVILDVSRVHESQHGLIQQAIDDQQHIWVRKTVMLLWDFAHEMWEHRNSVLHDTNLTASRATREAEINDAITKLYDNVDTYSADDQWYFDMPLAIRLRKPLRSRRRWLVNA